MFIARCNEAAEIQALKNHCINTANYAALFGRQVQLEAICRFAGILHDMGKYQPSFQAYIKNAYAADAENKPTGSKVDHGKVGAQYVYKLPAESIPAQLLKDIFAHCIAYHHGGLVDYVSFDGTSKLYDRLHSIDTAEYDEAVSGFFKDCMDEASLLGLHKCAVEELASMCKKIGKTLNPHFSFYIIIKFIYSCLIDADRLDAFAFAEKKSQIKPNTILPFLDTYRRRLADYLKTIQEPESSSVHSAHIQTLRTNINAECKLFGKTHKTGLYTLTVPVGGGKTLASLNLALEHCTALRGTSEEKHRIIYVLPYTTIIEQNAETVRTVLDCANELLEHHSSVVFSDDEDERKYKLLTERWDTPIIFTTFVQFLNVLFEGGTQGVRRLHHLANTIIIFDEIQSLPLHCVHMFNDALNVLSYLLNTTAILCTATQPDFQSVAVPLLFRNPSEVIEDVPFHFEQFRRIQLRNKCVLDAQGMSLETLVSFIQELGAEYTSILVIMNTKKGVSEVYNELCESTRGHKLVYLTTALCPAHRKKVIANVKTALTKKEPLICISTNLIECGVDISFDTAIRNLAGLPSIMQTGGRVNRHGEHAEAYLYLTDYNESLNKMPEIYLGAKCTREILIDFQNAPSLVEGDLLSNKAISMYYKKYFTESKIEDKMSYPEKINGIRVRLYDLLNNGNADLKQYAYKKGFVFSHPFSSVGQIFKILPDNTDMMIVPYGEEGKEMISRLFSSELYSAGLNKKYALLKEMQQFCVTVYAYEKDELVRTGYAKKVPDFENLYVLAEDAYNDICGLAARGEQKTLYI